MRCRNCEYRLDHLAVFRCPECGTSFDPEDPNTYDIEPRQKIIPALVGACAISYVVSFGVILLRRQTRTTDDVLHAAFFALVATSIAAVILFLFIAYSARRQRQLSRRKRQDQSRD